MVGLIVEWLPVVTLIVGGGFALLRWQDQRRRELQERRFEQYWKLVDVSQESTFLAKQKVALLLLKRYPEFAEETVEFLREAKSKDGTWTRQNVRQIDSVLAHLKK